MTRKKSPSCGTGAKVVVVITGNVGVTHDGGTPTFVPMQQQVRVFTELDPMNFLDLIRTRRLQLQEAAAHLGPGRRRHAGAGATFTDGARPG